MTASVDVLVVGGGPTGLTLAAQLHALGASVRIVDRQADRVHESRALAVQPRTLEVLRGLGIAQALIERGNAASQLRIHAGERVVPARLFDIGLDDCAYPFLLFISQAETEALLNERLAAHGLHVERPVELLGFEPGEDDVMCALRRGDGAIEPVHARYLVGCDGAHSSVRHGVGIPSRAPPTRRPSSSATWRWTATWSATSRMPSSARTACSSSSRSRGRRPGACSGCDRRTPQTSAS